MKIGKFISTKLQSYCDWVVAKGFPWVISHLVVEKKIRPEFADTILAEKCRSDALGNNDKEIKKIKGCNIVFFEEADWSPEIRSLIYNKNTNKARKLMDTQGECFFNKYNAITFRIDNKIHVTMAEPHKKNLRELIRQDIEFIRHNHPLLKLPDDLEFYVSHKNSLQNLAHILFATSY